MIRHLATWRAELGILPHTYVHLNQLSPTIQFIIEEEKERQLVFLDVLVTRSEDRLSTAVYRKLTHTDWCIFKGSRIITLEVHLAHA